jgi:hypothetical protein
MPIDKQRQTVRADRQFVHWPPRRTQRPDGDVYWQVLPSMVGAVSLCDSGSQTLK